MTFERKHLILAALALFVTGEVEARVTRSRTKSIHRMSRSQSFKTATYNKMYSNDPCNSRNIAYSFEGLRACYRSKLGDFISSDGSWNASRTRVLDTSGNQKSVSIPVSTVNSHLYKKWANIYQSFIELQREKIKLAEQIEGLSETDDEDNLDQQIGDILQKMGDIEKKMDSLRTAPDAPQNAPMGKWQRLQRQHRDLAALNLGDTPVSPEPYLHTSPIVTTKTAQANMWTWDFSEAISKFIQNNPNAVLAALKYHLIRDISVFQDMSKGSYEEFIANKNFNVSIRLMNDDEDSLILKKIIKEGPTLYSFPIDAGDDLNYSIFANAGSGKKTII